MKRITIITLMFILIAVPVMAESSFNFSVSSGGSGGLYTNSSINYSHVSIRNGYRCNSRPVIYYVNHHHTNTYYGRHHVRPHHTRIVHRQEGRRYVNDFNHGRTVIVPSGQRRYYGF